MISLSINPGVSRVICSALLNWISWLSRMLRLLWTWFIKYRQIVLNTDYFPSITQSINSYRLTTYYSKKLRTPQYRPLNVWCLVSLHHPNCYKYHLQNVFLLSNRPSFWYLLFRTCSSVLHRITGFTSQVLSASLNSISMFDISSSHLRYI